MGVDQSEESMYALSWAIDYLVNDNGSEELNDHIILLYAQPSSRVYVDSSAIDILESIERCQKGVTATILEKAKGICSRKKVGVEIKVVVGDPRNVICDQVDKLQVDFLVVGSRGKGSLKRALLGSVSDYCAHRAKCPVVIVKQPKK